jgi:hypothetical protein
MGKKNSEQATRRLTQQIADHQEKRIRNNQRFKSTSGFRSGDRTFPDSLNYWQVHKDCILVPMPQLRNRPFTQQPNKP